MTFEQAVDSYGRTLQWVGRLAAATTADQMGLPTPCDSWSVSDLLGHLIGTAERSLGTAEGRDTSTVPHVVLDIATADRAGRYQQLAVKIVNAWSGRHPQQALVAPWGPCTAAHAVLGFSIETLVHGWDLAVATGQPVEAPDGAAESVVAVVDDVVPAGTRARMYEQARVSTPGAGPTEQLAHKMGHHR